ncbi:hypothetical protein P153DRAFT_285501 [Dothidotthia symphoricarpi CBS 119687]|uniref:Ngg1p interacting factor 3 nif3 protein n=1 Tax=Dothidotthia symphoricarpi CBS 119687 TaxID=1392245 RepID=A0A6A6AN23_9PLEO|nr:uncharacterized protein P153DRAFT_285501 [Dothidotthia symphoricarpi CBS 119687]KAF2132334.1 hypothetical protein P153DRAFT_285501 [Dothidotthia symphoricarpi CBS 119687]
MGFQKQKKPTHALVTQLVTSVLPHKENDVPRLYHVPRNPRYDPGTAVVEHIVLSVTPTPGVYSLIGYPPAELSEVSTLSIPANSTRQPRTLCFLHRPFTLDRRNVRRGTLVLSSHTSFDEVLTTGWNLPLAERLGMNVGESLCIQGYKGDPERKIGILGQIHTPRELLLQHVQQEFGDLEHVHDGLSDEIRVVAIMNAFNEEEVRRVVDMTQQAGWAAPDDDAPGRHVLYLTGQPRALGLEAARTLGVTVACVGHKQAEEWGIRYMAARLRTEFPGVRIDEVYEQEEPVVKKQKPLLVEPITTA